jgi:hypothetical protein
MPLPAHSPGVLAEISILYRPRIQTLGGLPVMVMENAAPHRMSHAA